LKTVTQREPPQSVEVLELAGAGVLGAQHGSEAPSWSLFIGLTPLTHRDVGGGEFAVVSVPTEGLTWSMARGRATIYDVASAAAVAPSTCSWPNRAQSVQDRRAGASGR
jgi:hypothetical protein